MEAETTARVLVASLVLVGPGVGGHDAVLFRVMDPALRAVGLDRLQAFSQHAGQFTDGGAVGVG